MSATVHGTQGEQPIEDDGRSIEDIERETALRNLRAARLRESAERDHARTEALRFERESKRRKLFSVCALPLATALGVVADVPQVVGARRARLATVKLGHRTRQLARQPPRVDRVVLRPPAALCPFCGTAGDSSGGVSKVAKRNEAAGEKSAASMELLIRPGWCPRGLL
jgi:hypothetical protein